MALNAYLRLKGTHSGLIKGAVTLKGREDSIPVIAARHGVVSPRDAASGLPTGRRQHKPLVITKPVDRASPLLYNMLCTNESASEFVLNFWAPAGSKGLPPLGIAPVHTATSATEKLVYTIRLTNASVAAIDFVLPNDRAPDTAGMDEYEEIAFTYGNISWTWTDGGISADDDWETPVA